MDIVNPDSHEVENIGHLSKFSIQLLIEIFQNIMSDDFSGIRMSSKGNSIVIIYIR